MFYKLLRFSLREQFGLSAFKQNFHNDRKQGLKGIGMIALLIFAFANIAFMIGMYCYLIFSQPNAEGLSAGMLAAMLTGGQIMALFTLMRTLPGYLSTSRDLFFLRSLPLRDSDVLGARLCQALLFPVLTQFLLLGPAAILYAIFQGGGIILILKALLVALMAPMIPAALAGAGALLILSFSAKKRRSEHLLTALWFALVIAMMMGNQWLARLFGGMDSPETISPMLATIEGGINSMTRAYPIAKWGALAIATPGLSGLLYLLLYAAISAAAFGLLWKAGGRLYARAAIAGFEVATDSGKTKRFGEDKQAVRTPVVALVAREWRTLIRSSVYTLNGLIGIIMGPMMIIMMRISTGDEWSELLSLIGTLPNGGMWIVAALSAFIGCMNPAVSTSISREGRTFWISKMIPVPYAAQARAKLIMGMTVSGLGTVLSAAGGVVLLGIPVVEAFLGMLIGLLFAYPVTVLGLLLDIFRPNLLWVNETAAIKRSVNVLLHMLAGMLLAAGLAFVVIIMGNLRLYVLLAVEILLAAAAALCFAPLANRFYKSIDC